MKLDLVERKVLTFGIPIFFLIFLFLPRDLGMKVLYLSAFVFFLILFFLCLYWTSEWHPERKFLIGFLVSFLHTFVFLFAGVLGLILAIFVSKISPPLIDYFKGVIKF
jgi:hypothetical protein